MPIHDIFSRMRERAERTSEPMPPEAGTWGFYHPQLDTIGQRYGVWRRPGERNQPYRHRIGIEIAEKLNALEADLKAVLDYDKQ